MSIFHSLIHPIHQIKRKEIFILILCLLVGFSLRFYTFDHKSLWIDEVHTFNDSREGLKGQIKYFKENPADFLHPPLFFVLTHLFYPFHKAGKRPPYHSPDLWNSLHTNDLFSCKIIFSSHCYSMCSFFDLHDLSYQFFPRWPFLFVAYVSWNGWTLLLLEHLKTYKKRDLFCAAFSFAILFYTSYSCDPIYCSISDSLVLSDG